MGPPMLPGDAEILLAALNADLKERMRVIPTPPEGFDPVAAPDETLAKYGYPVRPPEAAGKYAIALWTQLVSGEKTVVPSTLPKLGPDDLGYRLSLNAATAGPSGGGRHEGSRNWSGALVVQRNAGQVRQVFGSWTVPRPKLPAPALPQQPEYRCSTWIGLDGHRGFSNSLPQIGTTQSIKLVNGVAVTRIEAWWQWWLRGCKLPPIPIDPNFVVDVGDTVQAYLGTISRRRVLFVMRNFTKGTFARAEASLPQLIAKYCLPGSIRGSRGVEGNAAEWITERPMDLVTDAIFPLPDYGTVRFYDCIAITRPGGHYPVVRTLQAARLLSMVDRQTAPWRSAVISRPRNGGGTSVETVFR